MSGIIELKELIRKMSPTLNKGEYVFVTTSSTNLIDRQEIVCEFKEREGVSLIISKKKADELKFKYDYVASWITLTIHSSLAAVGLTAKISAELTHHEISCNIVAGYYHDHVFVAIKDANKAMKVLKRLSNR